jgi:uncharacterized HAD superfamily protein
VFTILDLDGTISDDEWRQDLILQHLPTSEEKYACYHDMCHLDDVINAHLIPSRRNIVITSRPTTVLNKTAKWLRRHDIEFDAIYCRGHSDFRPTADFKGEIISLFRTDSVIIALDDREDVIQRYRQLGYNAQRVLEKVK